MGHKWIPTPCRDTPLTKVTDQVGRFIRNVRLRTQFGAAAQPRYHVPNLAFQPELASDEVEDFLSDVQQAIDTCYQHRTALMRSRPIHSNVTPALASAITELKQLRDIVIKPADKNMGMTILDKSWYQAECDRVLGDQHTYAPVPAAQMPTIVSGLRHKLRQLLDTYQHVLPADVYKYMHASTMQTVHVPYLYLLPKVHKMEQVDRAHLHQLKGRPIAACHSWVTTSASIYLADVLNRACYSQFPQVLPDSITLVRLLEQTTVSKDAFLVTFDVENMYPSIDNAAAINACTQVVTDVDRNLVHELLSFVMLNAYCQNNGQYSRQLKGTAMGTNVAPPYANIYVAVLLEAAAKAQSAYWPAIYKRFIDDGFFVWEQDHASLLQFLHLLNTMLPNIKLTWSISSTQVDYMDLTITKVVDGDQAKFVVSTYQKPHNRYLYIPYTSFHRPHVFKAFIKGELLRYAATNTTAAGFHHMRSLFYSRLLDRGYPASVLDKLFQLVQHADRQAMLSAAPRVSRRDSRSYPVLVLPNGQFEMTASIGRVVNRVFARHKHHETVAALFGGTDAKVTVAFSKNQSLGGRFIRANH